MREIFRVCVSFTRGKNGSQPKIHAAHGFRIQAKTIRGFFPGLKPGAIFNSPRGLKTRWRPVTCTRTGGSYSDNAHFPFQLPDIGHSIGADPDLRGRAKEKAGGGQSPEGRGFSPAFCLALRGVGQQRGRQPGFEGVKHGD